MKILQETRQGLARLIGRLVMFFRQRFCGHEFTQWINQQHFMASFPHTAKRACKKCGRKQIETFYEYSGPHIKWET